MTMTRITLNVSGTCFEFDSTILENNTGQRLVGLCKNAQTEGKENVFCVDRPAKAFAAILTYYQTGELHIPLDMCPGSFQQEMEFWQVDQSELTECCSYRLNCFLDECETRRNFRSETARTQLSVTLPRTEGHNYLRCRLWSIVDFHESTLLAKAYFLFISCVVLISILSLALSTEKSLRRPMTKCEVQEFLDHSEHADAKLFAEKYDNLDCDNQNLDHDSEDYIEDIFDDDGLHFYDDNLKRNTTIKLKEMTVPIRAFYYLDMLLLVMFTGDVLVRVLCCPSIIRYFMSVVNIVDAIALLSSYIFLIVLNVEKEHRYAHSWLHVLNYFQVFRSLRLLRIAKYVRASRVLAYSLRQNIKDVVVLLLFLFFAVSTFACILYFAENRKIIQSIPRGWYFSVITLTTVGYGDITPKTTLGATAASMCGVLGIVLLAVTVPIFVNNFLSLYQCAVIDAFIENRKSKQVAKASGDRNRKCMNTVSVISDITLADMNPNN